MITGESKGIRDKGTERRFIALPLSYIAWEGAKDGIEPATDVVFPAFAKDGADKDRRDASGLFSPGGVRSPLNQCSPACIRLED